MRNYIRFTTAQKVFEKAEKIHRIDLLGGSAIALDEGDVYTNVLWLKFQQVRVPKHSPDGTVLHDESGKMLTEDMIQYTMFTSAASPIDTYKDGTPYVMKISKKDVLSSCKLLDLRDGAGMLSEYAKTFMMLNPQPVQQPIEAPAASDTDSKGAEIMPFPGAPAVEIHDAAPISDEAAEMSEAVEAIEENIEEKAEEKTEE